jgi:hypothetical protein
MNPNNNLFYRIVHKFTDGTNNKIELNPSSFPFNGLCRVVVESVNFNQLNVAVATTSSVFITMDTNQPYSQDNLNGTVIPNYNPTRIIATIPNTTAPPFNAYLSTTEPNEILTHLNPSQIITLNVFQDDKVVVPAFTSCVVVLKIYKL